MMLLCRHNAIPSGLKMKFKLRGQENIMPSALDEALNVFMPTGF
jgi:hypothetical protein